MHKITYSLTFPDFWKLIEISENRLRVMTTETSNYCSSLPRSIQLFWEMSVKSENCLRFSTKLLQNTERKKIHCISEQWSFTGPSKYNMTTRWGEHNNLSHEKQLKRTCKAQLDNFGKCFWTYSIATSIFSIHYGRVFINGKKLFSIGITLLGMLIIFV